MEIVLPEHRPRVVVTIRGGTAVISPVIKSDRRFFEEGLEMLSIESRYARFGQGLSHLSERELDYLTDVDQVRHVALGAAVDGEVAGVGRYIAVDAKCPEVALTVLDEFQGRGIGPILFAALAAVARHDAHDELCFEARDDNTAVVKILESYELTSLALGGLFDRQIRLTDLPATEDDEEFVKMVLEARATR